MNPIAMATRDHWDVANPNRRRTARTLQMVRFRDSFEKLLVHSFTKMQVVGTVPEVGGVRIAHAQVMEVREV